MKKVRIAQIGISHEHAAGKMQTLLKMQDVFEIAGIVAFRSMVPFGYMFATFVLPSRNTYCRRLLPSI